MRIVTHPEVSESAERAIVITGARRTGTTLVGQLIHTLDGVEHANEPPFLSYLFPMMAQLPEDTWCQLYEAYLYEEVLIPALAGRSINLNPHDASSIRKVKSEEDINTRLGHSYRRPELVEMARKAHVSFKTPQLVPCLETFQGRYPDAHVLLMVRRPDAVAASVVAKGWYDDKSPHSATAGRFVRVVEGKPLPHWVEDDMVDRWWTMSAAERALYDYIRQYEQAPSPVRAEVVDYDNLVSQPEYWLAQFASRLGLRFGPKTERRLEDVFQRPKDNSEVLAAADASLVKRAWRVYEGLADATQAAPSRAGNTGA